MARYRHVSTSVLAAAAVLHAALLLLQCGSLDADGNSDLQVVQIGGGGGAAGGPTSCAPLICVSDCRTGYKLDANSCPTCQCDCSGFPKCSPPKACLFGNIYNDAGCDTCKCRGEPNVASPRSSGAASVMATSRAWAALLPVAGAVCRLLLVR